MKTKLTEKKKVIRKEEEIKIVKTKNADSNPDDKQPKMDAPVKELSIFEQLSLEAANSNIKISDPDVDDDDKDDDTIDFLDDGYVDEKVDDNEVLSKKEVSALVKNSPDPDSKKDKDEDDDKQDVDNDSDPTMIMGEMKGPSFILWHLDEFVQSMDKLNVPTADLKKLRNALDLELQRRADSQFNADSQMRYKTLMDSHILGKVDKKSALDDVNDDINKLFN